MKLLPPAIAAADHPLYGVLLERAGATAGPARPDRTSSRSWWRAAGCAARCRRDVPRARGGRADAVLRPRLRLLVGRADRLLRGGRPGVRVGDQLRGLRVARDFIDPARALRGGPAARPRLPVRRRHPAPPALRGRAGARAPSCAPSPCRPRARSCACCVTSRARRTRSPPCGRAARSRCSPARRRCYRGEPMVDGGLLESIPYRTALREGATHVLVLRSRAASYRATPRGSASSSRCSARTHPALVPLLRSCGERYNADALEPTPAAASAAATARAAGRRPGRQPPGVAAAAPTAPASPTASGSARTRWRPRSTAPGPRSSGSRSPSCSLGAKPGSLLPSGGRPSSSRAGGRGGPTWGRRRRPRGSPARAPARSDQARRDRGPLARRADRPRSAAAGRARRAAPSMSC